MKPADENGQNSRFYGKIAYISDAYMVDDFEGKTA